MDPLSSAVWIRVYSEGRHRFTNGSHADGAGSSRLRSTLGRRLRSLACVLLLALVASATALAATSSSTVYYAGNQYQPKRLPVKRHGYYRNVSLHGLLWSSWGGSQTTAEGTFTYQFCVEEKCSLAPFFDEPAVVVLGGIESCHGRKSYTTLALTIDGSMPDESFKGFRTIVGACPPRRSSGR
jgi:hypothetical protein